MKSSDIRAAGVISVMSNILPGPIQRLTELLNEGNAEEADRLAAAMAPLFACVGVTTQEETPYGSVECKARNPLAVKSLMNVLGMPSGPTPSAWKNDASGNRRRAERGSSGPCQ